MNRKLSIPSCIISRLHDKIIIQRVANKYSENVAKLKYVGMILTNQKFIQDVRAD